jgi:hypothetical protein
MTRSVIKCLLAAISIGLAALSAIAQTPIHVQQKHCHEPLKYYSDLGFDDEESLIAACAAEAFALSGGFSFREFEDVPFVDNKTVRLTGPYIAVDLTDFSRPCASRLYADRVCIKHKEVFDAAWSEKGCPLKRVLETTTNELESIALQRFLGIRWKLCTSISDRQIGHGIRYESATDMRFGISSHDEYIFAQDLSFIRTNGDELHLKKYVFDGGLVVDQSQLGGIRMDSVVVVGDLEITGSTVDHLRLKNVWVTGDLIYTSNRQSHIALQGVTLGGRLVMENIEHIANPDGFTGIYIENLAPIGGVKIETERACSDQVCQQQYDNLQKSAVAQFEALKRRVSSDR